MEGMRRAVLAADTRQGAAITLGWIGDARAVEPLIEAMKKDKDFLSQVKPKAAEALGKIGDARAVEPLTQVLGDKDWYVRYRTEEALEKIIGEKS